MLDREHINRYIAAEFPDLKNTEFQLSDSALSVFSEKTLLPFLIYQNTVDAKNRIIELYLRENSHSIYLLPFYVAVGFYRKAVNRALVTKKFTNERFGPNQKPVRYNGSICHITAINFISRTINLRGGTGDMEVSFAEDYKLKWDNYTSSADVRKRLDFFSKVDEAGSKNIFTLPLRDAVTDYEGVVLFSNVSRFETLLRNLQISGNDLREHLHIQGAVFQEEGIKLRRISAPKTAGLPVTILVSRQDSVMAFDHLIASGGGSIDHLNTVIIDDFDELTGRWEKAGILEEKMQELKAIFFDRIGTALKDIYLICKNRNFSVHQLLQKYGIGSLPWQLLPDEKVALDDLRIRRTFTEVRSFSDSFTETALQQADDLLAHWKQLGQDQFCDGQTFVQIKSLYTLREKLRSFCQPESLRRLAGSAASQLGAFGDLWFRNNQDNGLIRRTVEFLGIIAGNTEKYSVLSADLCTILSAADLRYGLTVVTNNSSGEDRQFFATLLLKAFPGTEPAFYTLKEFMQSVTDEQALPGLTLIFSWNKDLLNHVLTNLSAEKQVFLVSRKSRRMIYNHFRRALPDLEKITDTALQYDLLNLEPSGREQPPGTIITGELTEEPETAEQTIEAENEEFPEYVYQALDRLKSTGAMAKRKAAPECLVYFGDGSNVAWPESKSVFYFDEHADESNESVQKEARKLVAGDLVLLPKNRTEIKNILRNALIQDPKLSEMIRYDDEWRKKIITYISDRGMETEAFRDELETAGFYIVSPWTIRNWMDGETIQPHKFAFLLKTLIAMDILRDEMGDRYLNCNRMLKRQKVMFVRSAVKKLIFSLRGIRYKDDGIFDQRLINLFLDHVDLKPVLAIYTK